MWNSMTTGSYRVLGLLVGAMLCSTALAKDVAVPILFEPNVGQYPKDVQFAARGKGVTTFLTSTGVAVSFAGVSASSMRFTPVGSASLARPVGEQRLSGTLNYFRGRQSRRWVTKVPAYGRVRYQDVYPGISLVFYGSGGRLEYDWVVAPGADPSRISFRIDGTGKVAVDSAGDLVLRAPGGTARLKKPRIYQLVNAGREEIAGGYVLRGAQRVGFRLGDYDRTAPLVIDPVLSYSTYLGGPGDDAYSLIAVDAAGNAYAAASFNVEASLPATPGAFQAEVRGGAEIVVVKLNPAGELVYVTYLGGALDDSITGLAADDSGNAYVTGNTASSDFPTTTGAFLRTYSGGWANAFAAKLNPDGTALVYSTYLGDTKSYGIAVDQAGFAYLTGTTYADNFFATAGAYQTRLAGSNDVIVVKLKPDGSAPVYATYLGGAGLDEGGAIAVDQQGNAYVTGGAQSADFPVTQGSYQTISAAQDAFVAKLSADGSHLIYSTYLGGSGAEGGFHISVDSAGNALVAGITQSQDFPTTPGAVALGTGQGLLTKLDPTGSHLVFSTTGPFWNGVTTDAGGNVYLAGGGDPAAVISSNAVQDKLRGGAWIVKLDPKGDEVLFSSYLGGSHMDYATAIAVDRAGDVYVTGETESEDFPVTPAATQLALAGDNDAFITKIGMSANPALATVSAASFGKGIPVAPGSIATAFGSNLAQWTEAAATLPLPTSLGGIAVRVKDSSGTEFAAPLFYASAGQINYLVPDGAQRGPATVAVTAGSNTVATGWVQIDSVAPALFSANSDGRGAAAAQAVKVAADGSTTMQLTCRCSSTPGTCSTEPVDLGAEGDQVLLVLYGTGIRGRSDLTKLAVQIDGMDAPVDYAGAQSQYAGLDQLNVRASRELAGRGEVDLTLKVDDRAANPIKVNFK